MVSFAFEHIFTHKIFGYPQLYHQSMGSLSKNPAAVASPLLYFTRFSQKASADFGPKCRNSTYNALADYVML